MNFRLYRATQNSINLELLTLGRLGHYFKTIGYFDNSLNVNILYEFESDLKSLRQKNELQNQLVVKTLSLKANAVIAAFSMDVIAQVLMTFNEIELKGFEPDFIFGEMVPACLKFDKKLIVNGYKSELIMTYEAFPQFFLDDKYELEGAICAYRKSSNGKLDLTPTLESKNLFDKLASMSLLSALKKKLKKDVMTTDFLAPQKLHF